jgi:hypothetical protein
MNKNANTVPSISPSVIVSIIGFILGINSQWNGLNTIVTVKPEYFR